LARRIIDISVPLESDIASDPPGHEQKDRLRRPQAEGSDGVELLPRPHVRRRAHRLTVACLPVKIKAASAG